MHSRESRPMTDPHQLRIASYNIRKALGTDRRRDPQRIMRVIAAMEADVVALQEADLRLPPRRPVFVAAELVERTGLMPVALDHDGPGLGWHGNILLARSDIEVIGSRRHDLPGLEPRGAVSAVLSRGGLRWRVLGAHLGLLRHSRRRQLSALMEQLAEVDPLPTVMLGDFNERSGVVGLGRLARHLRILPSGPTWHSRHPLFALDRIAVSTDITDARTLVWQSPEARRASDHLPLIVDLALPR